MAGNCIRSVGKYIYDNSIITDTHITVETGSGIRHLELYTRNGKVTLVSVHMGAADFSPQSLPAACDAQHLVEYPLSIGITTYHVTCLSVGNPHCVVLCDNVDAVDVPAIGPLFENAPLFPVRVNTEFVRVVNKNMLKMRVWERGNGETLACGTGACAAVAAAIRNGHCVMGEDVVVKVRGGDLTVNCTEDDILLTGDTKLVFEGTVYY